MNQENEITATPTVGKNIFKLDGPIGRKRFITIYLALIFYTLLFVVALGYIYQLCEETFLLKLTTRTIAILYTILFIYISAINYIKRIFDLINNKEKAIFYTIALYIFNITTAIIQPLKLVGAIITTIIFAILLLKQGKLIKPTPTQTTDEQQV